MNVRERYAPINIRSKAQAWPDVVPEMTAGVTFIDLRCLFVGNAAEWQCRFNGRRKEWNCNEPPAAPAT